MNINSTMTDTNQIIINELLQDAYLSQCNSGIQLDLSSQARQRLFQAVANLNYSQGRSTQNEECVEATRLVGESLPIDSLKVALDQFKSSNSTFLHIKNLPQEKCDEILLALSFNIGFPYAHEREGPLIMHNKPKRHDTSAGDVAYYTWNLFHLHTELPYTSDPPDYIILYCVNNVKGGFTYVADVNRALMHLSPEHIEALKKPDFLIPIPPHFGDDVFQKHKRPVITQNGDVYELRVRFDNIECENDIGRKAIQALGKSLGYVREAVELRPGGALLINNRLSAHGRAPFCPTFDNNDRELHRTYVMQDIESFVGTYNPITRRTSGF